MRACTHSRKHACANACTPRKRKRAKKETGTRTGTCTRTFTCTHTRTPQTSTHTHTHTHTHTLAHTHTHPHTVSTVRLFSQKRGNGSQRSEHEPLQCNEPFRTAAQRTQHAQSPSWTAALSTRSPVTNSSFRRCTLAFSLAKSIHSTSSKSVKISLPSIRGWK